MRRLKFKASALGQDRDSSIRRTARLDAVFSALVSERFRDVSSRSDGADVDDDWGMVADDPPVFLSLI
jgi:hypothetical protein